MNGQVLLILVLLLSLEGFDSLQSSLRLKLRRCAENVLTSSTRTMNAISSPSKISISSSRGMRLESETDRMAASASVDAEEVSSSLVEAEASRGMRYDTYAMKVLNAMIIGSAMAFGGISKAAVNYDTPSPASSMPLETAIVNLEQASSRSDVVQAMADLYESSGTKTLLARSKFKYVSMYIYCRS